MKVGAEVDNLAALHSADGNQGRALITLAENTLEHFSQRDTGHEQVFRVFDRFCE